MVRKWTDFGVTEYQLLEDIKLIKWVRNVEVENKVPRDKSSIGVAPSSLGKSNCVTNSRPVSLGDSDVSVMPPNSPTGSTPRQLLKSWGHGVHEANRTNK